MAGRIRGEIEMNKKRFAGIVGIGCAGLLILLAIITLPFLLLQLPVGRVVTTEQSQATVAPGAVATQEVIGPLTLPPDALTPPPTLSALPGAAEGSLTALYGQLNPGVVNIQVFVEREGLSGQGAGSGFVLDEEGHIVTNNHVVAGAQRVTAIFYNGIEVEAEIVGTDEYSDLAVIRVDYLPEGVHPLPVGDSDGVVAGEWVVAIGNPFSLGGSMSLGIVSATGRSIPSGVTQFNIPQAIQTDAAINPGNSGGPLLNLSGEVIGVNAQIASAGAGVNSGVGFAIPSNVVRRVVPVLIASGSYQWPWLGVEGNSLNLIFQQANDLEIQRGAYIINVISDGPADEAGLQGASGTRQVDGFDVPVGGDVVVAADGERVPDFDTLLTLVASKNPGDAVVLTILRDGEEQQITVTLEARP
jgi:S1-C subfamily serine protease